MIKHFFWILLISSSVMFGNSAYIKDAELHKHNQKLLDSVLGKEFDPKNIEQIAQTLIKRGFHPEAYTVPKSSSFDSVALWEGEKDSIPLTFFVYVWPSYSGSNIHSHPITCGFAVLQGKLTQKNFEVISSKDKTVHLIHEETFEPGKGEYDDLKEPFIHQLYNSQKDSKPCLSLHVYGRGTEDKVMKTFQENYSATSYKEVEK